MPVTTTRYPRTNIVLRTNEVTNPSFSVDAATWVLIGGFGTGGAGTEGRAAITWSPYGGWCLRKQWTTAPTGGFNNAVGFRYPMSAPGGTGQTRTFSARVITSFPASVIAVARYLDAGGAILSSTNGAAVATDSNTWARPFVTAVNPAGTASVRFEVLLISTVSIPATGLMTLQTALSETTGYLNGTYFDGDTYATGNGTQSTSWTGAAGQSQSQLRDWNPDDVVAPVQLASGYDVTQQSRNVAHRLIDGVTVAALLPAETRTGTLRLFFDNAADAEAARALHAQATTFRYVDTDQPQENMTYVTAGPVRKYQTEGRLRWIMEVPYVELS